MMSTNDHNLPSLKLTRGTERAAHRALLLGLGLNRSDLEKPLIGVVNSFTDLVPGHLHLNELSTVIREGIAAAGGVAREFHTCAVCDGLAQGHGGMGYSLPSRETIADTVEIMARAHCLDGLVLLCGCDKIVPGQLMAALRLDLPAILVTSGCMPAGDWGPYENITLSSMREFAGAAAAGRISDVELKALEEAAIPGAGSCAMLGTANTMSLLGEAMGMTLPGMGSTPARSSAKLRLARASGEKVVQLVNESISARQIITREALLNAVTVDMALGGSTNSVLHLLALAYEAGVNLTLADFERLSNQVPHLCDLLPGGRYPVAELDREGGIPALFNELKPLLNLKLKTVSGLTVAAIVETAASAQGARNKHRVIHPLNTPLHPEGGLAILYGSLAPEGAVIKAAAIEPGSCVTEGEASVFDSLEEAVQATLAGKVQQGAIIVVRYEGPAGGPGMREMHMLSSLLSGMNSGAAVITDGRFSGSSRGLCIGHVSPEAAAGGPLALVKSGDRILIDLPARRLELLVPPTELDKRKPNPPKKEFPPGILERYRHLASSASTGAVLK
jgi:dihydroxy-acid dehydratase